MMLLPNLPDFCTSHRHLTEIHQIITTGAALLKEEKNDRAKCGTLCAHSTRRYVNTPCRIMPNEVFLPASFISSEKYITVSWGKPPPATPPPLSHPRLW